MTDYEKIKTLMQHLDLASDKNVDWFIKHVIWAIQKTEEEKKK